MTETNALFKNDYSHLISKVISYYTHSTEKTNQGGFLIHLESSSLDFGGLYGTADLGRRIRFFLSLLNQKRLRTTTPPSNATSPKENGGLTPNRTRELDWAYLDSDAVVNGLFWSPPPT
jgi:hypothetical protein